ncbi:MAG: aspartate kinase [Phycisphaerae bacterium]|nr:aspartate kinase [Phycisphaerae bacterium]
MSTVVMKFGGTSIAEAAKIRAAAARAIRAQRRGDQVVMVVSAMGETTDRLERVAKQISAEPPKRELDQLLATGEQVTISLMAMALDAAGAAAISFTAGQIGMITDDAHTKARIKTIDVRRIRQQLSAGKIVIVAGFQGITEAGHITTLGRGGSNVTLVALAAALGAEVCENYTDVDGIYTADPRIVPNARKINRIAYDEMLELASLGASVLHTRAVQFAKKYNVPIHVRNSANNRKGTMIVAETRDMERIVVSGAALKDKLARVTLKGVPNHPGVAARIFHTIATHNIVVDDIIQTTADDKTATVSFTMDLDDMNDARKVVDRLCKRLRCKAIYEDHMARVSVVGVGMRVHTGVADLMFAALAKAGINIENITTSEIKVSCLVDGKDGKKALRTVHAAFALGRGQYIHEPRVSARTAAKKKTKKATKKAARKKTARKKA